MAAKANSQQSLIIQKDWENREFVEVTHCSDFLAVAAVLTGIIVPLQVVELNILKIANFLNQFDMTVRYKLSELNEKMNKLERAIEYCEAATKSSLDKQITR
jgi:hypothetical protein